MEATAKRPVAFRFAMGEAIALYWNRDDCPDRKCLEVDLSGKRPMLVIPAELDKGGRDRVCRLHLSSPSSCSRRRKMNGAARVLGSAATPTIPRRDAVDSRLGRDRPHRRQGRREGQRGHRQDGQRLTIFAGRSASGGRRV